MGNLRRSPRKHVSPQIPKINFAAGENQPACFRAGVKRGRGVWSFALACSLLRGSEKRVHRHTGVVSGSLETAPPKGSRTGGATDLRISDRIQGVRVFGSYDKPLFVAADVCESPRNQASGGRIARSASIMQRGSSITRYPWRQVGDGDAD
jgi:hypothetical protein